MGRTPFRTRKSAWRAKSSTLGSMKTALAQQLSKHRRAGRVGEESLGEESDANSAVSSMGSSTEEVETEIHLNSATTLSTATLTTCGLREWQARRIAETSAGMQMTSRMKAALEVAVVPPARATSKRVVKAPPLFHEDVRTSAKGNRAGSTRHGVLKKWLGSDDGKSWVAQRRERLSVGEPDSLVPV